MTSNVLLAPETITRTCWRDWLALGKPRLSALVLATCAVGIRVAPGRVSLQRSLSTLLLTALVVGAANALNSYLERDVDRAMRRTRHRPLAAGRIAPHGALGMSLILAAASIGLLYRVANPVTALLAFVAFASYAFIYTPMKQVSWLAVWVGAVPGAIPPLMGYTAVTGSLGWGGASLFLLMFFWQLPHFFAIALYLAEDYGRGGLKVLPLVHGPRTTLWAMVGTSLLLFPAACLPAFWNAAGRIYLGVSVGLTAGLIGLSIWGLFRATPELGRFGRQFFLATVVHLSFLLIALSIFGRGTR